MIVRWRWRERGSLFLCVIPAWRGGLGGLGHDFPVEVDRACVGRDGRMSRAETRSGGVRQRVGDWLKRSAF